LSVFSPVCLLSCLSIHLSVYLYSSSRSRSADPHCVHCVSVSSLLHTASSRDPQGPVRLACQLLAPICIHNFCRNNGHSICALNLSEEQWSVCVCVSVLYIISSVMAGKCDFISDFETPKIKRGVPF
jgi:hypothetical protein